MVPTAITLMYLFLVSPFFFLCWFEGFHLIFVKVLKLDSIRVPRRLASRFPAVILVLVSTIAGILWQNIEFSDSRIFRPGAGIAQLLILCPVFLGYCLDFRNRQNKFCLVGFVLMTPVVIAMLWYFPRWIMELLWG
ncbi:MAG: hypothetical protein KC777_22510 [Cyanobacteria bacterium HKST-UBA02]|nr:hypothetical protein [Cyanobacteria bacterium HKST-UBA02]